jgi:hypothetical protein
VPNRSTSRTWASRSSAWAAMANIAMLAVVASRTKVIVWVSGSWRARARIRGASVSGQACSGMARPLSDPVVEICEDRVDSVGLVAGGGEIVADRIKLGAPVEAGDLIHQQRGGVAGVLHPAHRCSGRRAARAEQRIK